ncbi:MAG: polysulfide reductase NrfD [Chloroflexi bacterium]|nr:polysulfide reductase NrfD [Chloroflexota bacterium]
MRARAENFRERLERVVFNPINQTSKAYYVFLLFLLLVVGFGFYAFVVQFRFGLLSTGMRDQVIWGLYILDFIFFLGIAMAGTVISAVLRLTSAGWRTPITRMAEVVTAAALMIGALMPIIDLGRPDRVWHVLVYGRFQSAILWDIIVITTYLTGSLIYLYLPLIPDLAIMRDRLDRNASSLKKKVITYLAVGWRNTEQQRHRLEKAISIMAVAIIPMAVLTHTVASFIFAWMLRPGWNSTVYGIYFVIGAIFSGIATVLIVMAIFRKLYHLEEYITEKHFRYLSYLLLTLLLVYLYLVVTEYLTIGYKLQIEEKELLSLLFLGKASFYFWFFIVAGFVIPGFLLVSRIGKTIPRIIAAAISVNAAMWVSRLLIVVPTLQVPQMSELIGTYKPTWVEWAITGAAFAGFMLVFAIVVKLIPIVSIWEVAEEAELEAAPQHSSVLTDAQAQLSRVRGQG